MADHKHDSPEYRSAAARTVRAIDGAQNAGRDYFNHLSGHEGVGGFVKRGAIIGAASTVLGLGTFLVTVPGTPLPPADFDVSGHGLLNRAYAYQNYESMGDVGYLLLRDEGRYELYQWVRSRNRNELIEDPAIARQIISEMAALTQNTLNTFDFDRTDSFKIKMYQCDTIYDPVMVDGETVRYEGSCPMVQVNGSSARAHYQRAATFWNGALESMTADNYGPAGDVPNVVRPETDASILEYVTGFALGGLAGWAGFAGIGAGVAGMRRRARQAPTKRL